MCGSLGENQVLQMEEKRRVVKLAVDLSHGRVPVLSGVAETSTAAACRYAQDCEKLGADGLMLMPAMLYKGDPRETLTHFRTVAKTTGLPIMIYNNPISYANDITPEMFARLADVKKFCRARRKAPATPAALPTCIIPWGTAMRSSPAWMTSPWRAPCWAWTAGWLARASPFLAKTSTSGS